MATYDGYGNLVNEVSGVLVGKKWCAYGDSFTQYSTEKFSNGPFVGKNKVYPYFIGERNNMTVINDAVSGSTMTYVDGTMNEFSAENGLYTQVPDDADYITLAFGINDWHQVISMGTIDDAVNTTFYGAWNIVMEHLITNHPTAKIGIIIMSGYNTTWDTDPNKTYPDAMIAIAEKWGVPYLNMAYDPQIPVMQRSSRSATLPTSVKDAKRTAFSADMAKNNTHPNAVAHEYMSTFVEEFLKRL